MKKLLLGALCILTFSQSSATHIVGGELTYDHLGGSSYRILLKLYRAADLCDAHVALQNTAPIQIYSATGTFIQQIILNRIQLVPVDPYIDTCAAQPACVEIEMGLFTAVVNNLPPVPGGYHLYFETCCRNSAILNIVNPLNSGLGFYCKISDNTQILTNSSPKWKNPPPVFICQGQNVGFDHGATDADGDSLVYSYYTPFDDINYVAFNGGTPVLTFTAGNPNLQLVPWIAPFNANNPLDASGATTLSITSAGVINGIPPNLGQYVAGVRCDEYRDGQLVGSIFRDFQFNVVNCPPPALADITVAQNCDGTFQVDFVNSSTPSAQNFFWDFDINNATNDTLNTPGFTNPSFTYPGPTFGCYDVMLIAQKGTACADTTFQNVCINFLAADNTFNDTVCVGTPVTFNDLSTFGLGSSINSWFWDFDDGITSILPSPTHTFNSAGNYNVVLIVTSNVGCKDTIIKPMTVQGLPFANAGNDTVACINNPLIQLNGIVNNAGGGIWLNGSGVYNPGATTLNAQYTPTPGEVAGGFMYLVLATSANGVCPADDDSIRIDFVPGPSVDAGPDIQVCKDSTGIPLNGTVTVAGGGLWSTTGSGAFSPSPVVLNPTYTPSNADTAAGSITFYLTSTFNGNCIARTDTMIMSFYDPPVLVITTEDTTCTGQPVHLTANVTTGQGYWQTAGSGSFIPDSLLNSYYLPSAADAGAGSVTLLFTSTNNGGCKAVRDSLDIAIIPAPNPMYSTDSVCFGNVTTFTNTSNAVGGIAGYFWDFGDGIGTSTVASPTYTFLSEGTQNVFLVVTSNNGCRDTAFIPVMVHYLPNVAFTNPTPCLFGGTPFVDQTTVTGSTIIAWNWEFGDGGSDNIQNPTHQYPTSGSFPVTLTATSAFGCVDSLTQNTTILPAPIADFSMSDNSINPFSTVNFTDLSTPAPIVSWQWDFGDGTGNSTVQHPSYAYNGAGFFTVTLVVTDNNGCIDSVRQELIVFLPPFVPSGFSPTGDGTNDVLYVLGGPFTDLVFRIYNNWGELIFESTSQSIGWDGTYKDVPQPIGVYVWTVKAVTLDGEAHELKGDVTLLR